MRKIILKLIMVAIVLLCLVLVFYFVNPNNYPWEKGGKKPSEYTVEEFLSLSEEDQEAFFEWFGSAEEFEAWINEDKPKDINVSKVHPWEEGSKNPSEYTWEEFQKLDDDDKEAFFEGFETEEERDLWIEAEVPKEEEVFEENSPEPEKWESDGKDPSEYTWEEFSALSEPEQEAFFEWFESVEEFEKWKSEVKSGGTEESEELSWKKGGKKPSEYTWEEFMALNEFQQEEFFEWFDSSEEFEEWLNANKA